MVRSWGKRLIYDRTFRFMVIVGVVLAAALFHTLTPWFQGSKIVGKAQIVDGDSLRIGRQRLRLKGIDAPERRQNCFRDGRRRACGREAEVHLARLIGRREITCDVSSQDRYGRLLARCRVGKTDINRAMVMDGMAVAFGSAYRREEKEARARKRGLWAGEFVRPHLWRRDNPRE